MADNDLQSSVESSDSPLDRLDSILEGLGVDEPHQKQIRTIFLQYRWVGPLPPPQAIEAFDRVLPGLADRIVRMSEKALDSQIASDACVHDRQDRGQWLGFTIAVAGIAASLAIVFFRPSVGGFIMAGILGGGPMSGIIYSLVTGKNPKDSK